MNDKNAGIKDNNKLMCVSLLVYTLSLPWLTSDPGLVVVAFITWAAIGHLFFTFSLSLFCHFATFVC